MRDLKKNLQIIPNLWKSREKGIQIMPFAKYKIRVKLDKYKGE